MTDTSTAGRLRTIGAFYLAAVTAEEKGDEAALDAAISNLFETSTVLASERRLSQGEMIG